MFFIWGEQSMRAVFCLLVVFGLSGVAWSGFWSWSWYAAGTLTLVMIYVQLKVEGCRAAAGWDI